MPVALPPGVLVRDLSSSELAFRLLGHARRRPLAFFQEQPLLPVVEPAGPVLGTADAWGYRGPLVATTLGTAARLAAFPAPAARVFYVWDLEWLRLGAFPHAAVAAVYRDPRLALVCRHQDHRAAVEAAWARPVAGVVEDADPYAILGAACPTSP